MSHDSTKTAAQILFQNSLAEVVRKLRNSRKSEAETIAEAIQDIKAEISSPVQMVKVTAVVKLTYFTMLGYPADYAAFHVIEVMADSNFQNKRAGYIAAALTFNEHTDVLPLCTALLKRDLNSTNIYEVGLALYCLAAVCTPDLAKDLVTDVVNLLSHQKSYVRKKAVLCLYKIFLQYPDALRPTYPKLKDKLEDDSDKADNDPGVRGAVVNILCEMARRNPQNFLNLAVPFFSLLSTVHNNWTLIKVVKVFGYFAPLEPRLGKKLAEPISNLISTSGAKSVQYECVLAVANGMSKVTSVTKLAVEKMKFFVEDRDQNLKYLGLDAMTRIMIEAPKMLHDQRDTILACLNDVDVTIRRKALELLRGLATQKNLVATINSMFDACVRTPPDEDWSNLVITTIIETAQYDDYALVNDFEWYTGVLVDLSLIELTHFKHGELIEKELVTVMTRVNAIRPYGVEALSVLLSNSILLGCDISRSTQWMVLKAAAFVSGEYPHWLPNMELTLQCLLNEKIATLPVDLQVLCVAAAGKIYQYAVNPADRLVNLKDGEEEQTPKPPTDAAILKKILLPEPEEDTKNRPKALQSLEIFYHSVFPDVQERAQIIYYLVTKCGPEATAFFERELLAVAAGAQEAVSAPDGLDLDTPFCDDIPALISESEEESDDEEEAALNAESEAATRLRERKRREEVSAFYIKEGHGGNDLPPVTTLEAASSSPAGRSGNYRSDGGRQAGKKTHTINREMAKPTTYVASEKEKRSQQKEEDEATRRLRGIDVTSALTADEKLPESTTYAAMFSQKSKDLAEEQKRSVLALRVPPSVVYQDKNFRVVFQVIDTKCKKSGYYIETSCIVTNHATSTSMYEIKLNPKATMDILDSETGEPTGESEIVGYAEEAEEKGKKEKEEKDAPTPQTNAISCIERLKPSATASKDFVFHLEELPSSFNSPVNLTLTFTFDKKAQEIKLQFPLVFKYFAATTTEVPAAQDYNVTIIGKHLSSDAVISATIPLPHHIKDKHLLLAIPSINATLRTHTVEVFKDCCTLYGQMVSRKSHVNKSHIAILLKYNKAEASSEDGATAGENTLVIAVKSSSVPIADSIIQEIGQIIFKEAEEKTKVKESKK